jgi:hypothetical protein
MLSIVASYCEDVNIATYTAQRINSIHETGPTERG